MESAIGDPGKAVDLSDQSNAGLFRWLTILVALASLSALLMHQTDRESMNTVPVLRQSGRSKDNCAQADRLLRESLYTGAYDLFARASRLDERNPCAWIGRAKAACKLRNYQEARRSTIYGLMFCQEASGEQRSELWYYQAIADYAENDGAGTKFSLAACLKCNPRNSAALALLSQL